MEQQYNNYSVDDFKVWKILFERQFKNLSEIGSKEYLDALTRINFTKEKIPHFIETEVLLAKYTGWKLHVVPSIIPVKDFFELLIRKKFPATSWLRKMNQMDYLEEPDMFHDVFGHVPLLTNQAYTNFFISIAKLSVKHSNNENIQNLLGRIYWFTIEFGLIKENGNLKVYGAGLISSFGEAINSLTDKPKKFDYNVAAIINTPFRTDIFQEKYFVIDSFEQLYDSVGKIEELIESSV